NNLSETDHNVHIKYGRGVIITGNTFYMGETHNILIESSDNILLANNILDRNPHYGNKTMNTRAGIAIIDSRDILITGLQINNAKKNRAGSVIEDCRNVSLTNSMILNCDGAGIALIDSEESFITGNLINDHRSEIQNPIAITISGGNGNLVTNNRSNGTIVNRSNATTENNYTKRN